MAQVRQRGRTNPDQVETGVLVELLILDRDERLDQVRRYLRKRHLNPLLLEDRERELIAVVVHRGCLVHLADPSQRLRVWKPASETDEEPDEPDKTYGYHKGGPDEDPFQQPGLFNLQATPSVTQQGHA
jgi:hypothetical protein